MTYPETLDWLFSKLPMYQRVGGANYKIDLQNTHRLMDLLNHPERGLTCIHVAGTNGKGSVCHYLAAIFQQHGYRVGLYTSPHLLDFRERIKIDGTPISEDRVTQFVDRFGREMEGLHLSFFEMTVGLAFQVFRAESVDIAIIETGMGGRLDSTNVVTPELSIITNIGWDHQKFLGDTLPAIASEKAGIIKRNIPVLIGERQPEVASVFESVSRKLNAPLHWAEELGPAKLPPSDLSGAYQGANLRTALAAAELLRDKWLLRDDAIAAAVHKVVALTGLMGRWQWVSTTPKIVLEGAHNVSGIEWAVKSARSQDGGRVIWVFGTVADKDLDPILALLPRDFEYIFTQASIPRALDAVELQSRARAFGIEAPAVALVKDAIELAKTTLGSDDGLIMVGGSLFVVADALEVYS